MIYMLTICYSMFLGVCSNVQTVKLSSKADCEKERQFQVTNDHQKRITYAICRPIKEPT